MTDNRVTEWIKDSLVKYHGIETIIYTYQVFITSQELWDVIRSLFHEKVLDREKILRVVKVWIQVDLDPKMKKGIIEFSEVHLPQDLNSIALQLIKPNIKHNVPLSLENKGFHTCIDTMPINSLVEQLTLIDTRIINGIRPIDFINLKKGKEVPSIQKQVHFFNILSGWVASEIINASDKFSRNRCICNFIKLCDKLIKMNNYNSSAAILSGMNVTSVSRLKRLWESIDSKILKKKDAMDELMSPILNYKNYRAKIENQTNIVPYMAVLMRDFTFIWDGNESFLGTKVNNDKFEAITLFLKKFHLYRPECKIENDESYHRLLALGFEDEETLFEKSTKLLPCKNNLLNEPQTFDTCDTLVKPPNIEMLTMLGSEDSLVRLGSDDSFTTITSTDTSSEPREVKWNSKAYTEWEVEDVVEWLKFNDTEMDDTILEFIRKNSIDGSRLKDLNRKTLMDMGLCIVGLKLKLLKQIDYLSKNYQSKEITDWDIKEVVQWMNNQKLYIHIPTFLEHKITGEDLLDLSEKNFEELGITTLGYKKRLTRLLKDLRSSS